MPTHSALRRIVFVAIPLALSCHDAPTSPGSNPLAPPGSPARDASPGSTQGPVSIPIPSVNYPGGGALAWTSTGMTVPAWTSYVVTVSGRTTASRNPAATQCSPGVTFPAEGSYGPSGTSYYELLVAAGWSSGGSSPSAISLNFVGYGTSGGNTATSDTLFTWSSGEIVVSRSGLAGVVGGGDPYCAAGLYLLSTTQAISLTTFDGQELSLSPSAVAVRSGTDVTFTATSRGAVVATPNWRFDVDSGVTNATTICGGLSGPNPCLVTVRTSGVLRASKNVQGRMRVAAARVRVYTNFTLTGEPSDVVRGDSVRFTPKLDGATGPAARWLWRGDDSTVVAAPCAAQTDSCVWVPQSSGTMWAYTAATGGDSASKHVSVAPPKLTLSASPTSLLTGDSSAFTVTANGAPLVVQGWAFRVDSGGGPGAVVGSPWGNCSPGMTQCSNAISASGTVIVLGTVRGVSSEDSVHLSVTSGCSSPSRIVSGGGFRATRSSDCMPGGDELSQPGGDVGPEDGSDCASMDSLLATTLPPTAATLALLSNQERHGGPSAETEEFDTFCALTGCTRDATPNEGMNILLSAIHSGEWIYTQGGYRGGIEPPKDIPSRHGDCTDLAWFSTTDALGSGWPHNYDNHLPTRLFHDLSTADLARAGYRRVPYDSAQVGDIVVRGGHAGVYGGTFTGPGGDYGIWGWANNGLPATPKRDNKDGFTGWYNFKWNYDDHHNEVDPEFFRPLVVVPCV